MNDDLNREFAISNHIRFVDGPGGRPIARIQNALGSADVALQGAQVLSFQPENEAPVLWQSRAAVFAAGKAVRGGIPVCWPWFGPHPLVPAAPAHGFARTVPWQVRSAAARADGATELRLTLSDDVDTRALWPYAFDLRLLVVVGRDLRVELRTTNPGTLPFSYSGALHSYFAVGDVEAMAIEGLDGCTYIDQIDGNQRKHQSGPVVINAEVDRIYLDTTATCSIVDHKLARRIRIAKEGSRSTVVWNPWIAKAARLVDFGDDEYHSMVCIETANAADDNVRLNPSEEAILAAVISVERSERVTR